MQEYRVTVGEYAPGAVRYYKPGTKELHRVGGPAVELVDGTKYWFQNGMLHRTDGPASELANGTKSWCQNDQLHRTDGPAVENAIGTVEYYIHGEWLTLAQFKEATAPKAKEMTVAEIEATLGHSVKIIK